MTESESSRGHGNLGPLSGGIAKLWAMVRDALLNLRHSDPGKRAASAVQDLRDSDASKRAATALHDLKESDASKRAATALHDLKESDAGKRAMSAWQDLRKNESVRKAEETARRAMHDLRGGSRGDGGGSSDTTVG
jgi:hypothetical protein